jgi:hypothetical protein
MVRIEPGPACVRPSTREAWPLGEGVGVSPATAPLFCASGMTQQPCEALGPLQALRLRPAVAAMPRKARRGDHEGRHALADAKPVEP